MKVLYLSNIPTPYRNDYFNELGKYVDLTVVFEATGAENRGIHFNWDATLIRTYNAVFLSDGDIEEHKVNAKVFHYLSMDYDHIFVTNYAYFTEMAAVLYLKLHRIPYTMEIDGGIIKPENAAKHLLKKLLISGAKSYFSPGKETDRYLCSYGVQPELIRRQPFTSLKQEQILREPLSRIQKLTIREKLGIEDSRVVVGVGQLIKRKGWDLLMNIAQDVDAGIYILGEGELRKSFEKTISDRGLTNVHFVGFKSNEETAAFYQAADVFVLPTRYDIWGLVVNEAMAYGLPVVTTETCNAGAELIEHGVNGFLVPKDSLTELRQAVMAALEDADRMGKASLSRITDYTIEGMVGVHLDYLKQGE